MTRKEIINDVIHSTFGISIIEFKRKKFGSSHTQHPVIKSIVLLYNTMLHMKAPAIATELGLEYRNTKYHLDKAKEMYKTDKHFSSTIDEMMERVISEEKKNA